MKGDFSRLPFQVDIETKHYGAVLDQQGRVKTDYDKAVEVAIESHLRQHALRDIIGRSGAPADNPGFRLTPTPRRDLIIGAGDYYVDGILCTNDRDSSLRSSRIFQARSCRDPPGAIWPISGCSNVTSPQSRIQRFARLRLAARIPRRACDGLRSPTVPGGTGRTLPEPAAGMGAGDRARQRPAVCARTPL